MSYYSSSKKMRHFRLKLKSCALADCKALQKAPERRLSCVYIRCVFLSLPAPYWYIRCLFLSVRTCTPTRRAGTGHLGPAEGPRAASAARAPGSTRTACARQCCRSNHARRGRCPTAEGGGEGGGKQSHTKRRQLSWSGWQARLRKW